VRTEGPRQKRVLGGIIIIGVMFATIWSCCKEGMTENNKFIIETEIICATAMLGVSNITNIWKRDTAYYDAYKDANEETDKNN
jgi:hypothetical protein